jgi:hypothetical protein
MSELSSTRQNDIVITIALFTCDLFLLPLLFLMHEAVWNIDWLGHQGPQNPNAAQEAAGFVKFLAVGAIVTGGPLLACRRWISGTMQLVIMGGMAIALHLTPTC